MSSKGYAAGVSLAAICISLAACGKGDVDSTPTPTPTPSPTATATQGPSPDYLTVDQIMAKGGDKTFTNAGVKYQSLSPKSGEATFGPGNSLVLQYFETGNTYRISRPNPAATPTPTPTPTPAPTPTPTPTATATPIQVNFDAASGTTNGQVTTFTKTTGSVVDTLFLIVPQNEGVNLTYTRFATYVHDEPGTASDLTYRTVYGSLTQNGDMPLSGTATYSTNVLGTATRSGTSYLLDGTSTGTFSVAFTGTGGTITNTLDIKGKENPGSSVTNFGTFTGTGAIAGSGFTGTLTGSGSATGGFGGAFFGPRAAEYGYGWYVTGSDYQADGYASGVKNAPPPAP